MQSIFQYNKLESVVVKLQVRYQLCVQVYKCGLHSRALPSGCGEQPTALVPACDVQGCLWGLSGQWPDKMQSVLALTTFRLERVKDTRIAIFSCLFTARSLGITSPWLVKTAIAVYVSLHRPLSATESGPHCTHVPQPGADLEGGLNWNMLTCRSGNETSYRVW